MYRRFTLAGFNLKFMINKVHKTFCTRPATRCDVWSRHLNVHAYPVVVGSYVRAGRVPRHPALLEANNHWCSGDLRPRYPSRDGEALSRPGYTQLFVASSDKLRLL